jgi:hypothetical protein
MRGLLIVLLFLAPLAAGCGSDPSSFDGSGDALKDASSSRVEWRMEGKSLPEWALMRATGSLDYANGRGEMVIKGKSDAAPMARGLYIGHESYMGAEVAGTTYWMRSSVDDGTDTDRFMPGPNGLSPDRLLNELIKSSTKVDKLGSEEIRGVDTTHYRGHLERTKHETEPGVVDVWIDGQGLPRRIRATRGQGDDFADVVDLFDFGVQVDVEAPPADEVVSEDKFDKVLKKECAKVKSAKDLEDANPLCLIFTATLEPSDNDVQISPSETVTTTEGK